MPPKTGTTQKFIVDDLIFFLNIEGVSSSGMNKNQMIERIGSVTHEQIDMLRRYQSIMSNTEYIEELQQKGWFHKNYETVKKQIEVYFARRGISFVYNKSKKGTNREDISKLLFFCQLKGHIIPSETIKLIPEQEEVLSVTEGIKIVNSGPGTGKTTTCVYLACKLMHEGVWLVSYTNAAVKNIMQRLYEIVPDVRQVSNETGRKICVSTIDTISRPNNKDAYKNVSFEKRIIAANQDLEQKTDIFLDHENELRYQHLIIDEAQDIDDNRFKYLFNIFKTWNFKSMTIVGDPKQRLNITAGAIFQKLFSTGIKKDRYLLDQAVKWDSSKLRWIDEDNDEEFDGEWYINSRPLIFEYTVTFRFRNPILLELANKLSSKRPMIHSELHLHESIDTIEPVKISKFSTIEEVASEIDFLITSGVRPNQICLISPITEKACKIRTQFKDIQQLLSTRQIICDDNLRDNTIYATSILSCKGLEFDYVFFVGASRFPSSIQSSLQDVNDGVSMNFVANTRARNAIYYLTDASKLPPDDVPQEFVNGEIINRVNYTRKETYRLTIRSDLITPDQYYEYEARNRPFLAVSQKDLCIFDKYKYHHYVYEIISAVLAELGGYNKFQANDKFHIVSDANYNEGYRIGKYYECTGVMNKVQCLFVSESMKEYVESLAEQEVDEHNIDHHRLYAQLMNNRVSSLDNMQRITEPCNHIVSMIRKIIKKAPNNVTETAEHQTFGTYVKAPIIVGVTYALIFTESIFLAAQLKRNSMNKRVIMIGLETGRNIEIIQTPSSIRRYDKVMQDLYTLSSHDRLMQERGQFTLAEVAHDKEIYFVDTEFTSTAWNKSGTIYEIAVINAFDRFKSFITYIRPDPRRFRIMVGDETLQYDHIKDAPTIMEFVSIFNTFNPPSKTIIYYFSTSHDISPFYETHPKYEDAWNSEDGDFSKVSQEKNDWVYDPTIDYGYTFINGRSGSGQGKLNEVYNQTTKSALQSMPHLIHHVAISDALMLLEYVFTRDHPVIRDS